MTTYEFGTWYPVDENTPRDGSAIIVRCDPRYSGEEHIFACVYWSGCSQQDWVICGLVPNQIDLPELDGEPTHWMPSPKPPEDRK